VRAAHHPDRLVHTPQRTKRLILLICGLVSLTAARARASSPQEGIALALKFTVTIEGGGVYGSGVLVAPDEGLIVTNFHVVDGMSEPRVTFEDGRTATAKVLEVDRGLDLALLKVPPQKRAAPVMSDLASVRPGDEVYAVGCPRHLAFTVSRGIVSFVNRLVEGTRYVQTDLPINDGNSGGPVVNARGELVGLMTFVYRRAQGLSFALPIHYAFERFSSRLGRYATRSSPSGPRPSSPPQ
jgi:S1-C subfamily serine protease